MPIARVSGKLVLFMHVPRCGGTSMEDYLEARFGPLAFRSRFFLDLPPPMRWTRTAPQHVAATDLARLFPEGFLDEAFAIVRHPVERLKSVFRFQRDVERRFGPRLDFERWLVRMQKQEAMQPFVVDNHIRPMTEMVPEGARIFHLEQGMDPVIAWLDDLAGGPAPDVPMKLRNNFAERVAWAKIEPGPEPVVTDRVIEILSTRYVRDFERFGYALERPGADTDEGTDTSADKGPDKGADKGSGRTPAP